MNVYPIVFAVITGLLLSMASCSVKEDRHDCPVILSLDMSRSGAENQNLVISTAGESLQLKQYYYPGLSDSLLLFQMPKGQLLVCGISLLQSCYVDNLTIRCSEGYQCDRLYTYSKTIDALGEYAAETVIMHKQHAVIDIDLSKILSREDYGCELVMKGNYSALDLIDSTPLAFSFMALCECVDSTLYRVRVPRQGDDGLEMELKLSSGELMSFPVGAMLRQSGFDWKAEDLDDAKIEIIAVEAGITITIRDWETGFEKDVRI